MASSDQFIPGICNFCNRWCERCSKSRNCLSFAHDQIKQGIDPIASNNDQQNKEFWNTIESVLGADIIGLIKDSAKPAHEIQPENLTDMAENHGMRHIRSIERQITGMANTMRTEFIVMLQKG